MNSPKDIANNYISVAKNKVATPVAKTLVLAFLAGAFIALAGISSWKWGKRRARHAKAKRQVSSPNALPWQATNC